MMDDSQNGSNNDDGSKKFEFDPAGIPGLDLAFDPLPSQEPIVSPDFFSSGDGAIDSAQPVEPQLEPATEAVSETVSPPAEEPAASALADLPPEASLVAAAVIAAPPPKEPEPKPATETIEKVREFSEKVPMEKVQVPAAFPFSLLIEGELAPEEKEKLLDVLSREAMGIREVDLEPQLAGNRILIPRISEYAGILLVQALRGTRARLRLGPSESIFSAQDCPDAVEDSMHPGFRLPDPESPVFPSPHHEDHDRTSSRSKNHPAERIAVTSDSQLPQFREFEAIDTVIASTTMASNLVEADKSPEYMDLVENLKRELKYKAHRKGGVGITNFKIELRHLSLATQYRLTLSGLAIRPTSLNGPVGETSEGSSEERPIPHH